MNLLFDLQHRYFQQLFRSPNSSTYCCLDLIGIRSCSTSGILNRCQFLRDWNKVMCDYFRFVKRKTVQYQMSLVKLRKHWTNRKINDAVAFSGLTYMTESPLCLHRTAHCLEKYNRLKKRTDNGDNINNNTDRGLECECSSLVLMHAF